MSQNSISDPNAIMVNGPVNVVRLEGNIHGIDKTIYLFMDYHIPVTSQTKCDNVFSDDVQKFFADNFYNLNDKDKMYDFFLEVHPSELAYKADRDSKEMYIEEVVDFFRKIFKYDPKKNTVSINKLFKNIRLHYLDIREFYQQKVHDRISKMSDIAHKYMISESIDTQSFSIIIDLMIEMRDHLGSIIDILSKKYDKKSAKSQIISKNKLQKLDTKTLNYLTNKLKMSYNYPDVQKTMNTLLQLSITNFRNTIGQIDEAIDTFEKYMKLVDESDGMLVVDHNSTYVYNYGVSIYTTREMIVDINNKVDLLLDEKFVEFFGRFTDIYFLRRFLDKDYITNAIVYSGAMHSNTYIYYLIKYFDFTITHVSYSKIKNLDNLTNEIKQRTLVDMQELILPKFFKQCSNLTKFPQDFE